MQNNSKTIIDIPAGGFYVYNPVGQPNVIPTSSGAFGCCYLTIKDGDNILVAHINATSIMLEPVAEQTVKKMLEAFQKAGGKMANAKIEIVHSNDPQEYERGFKNRPQNLTTEQKKPRGHYTEKFDENDFSLFVAEPFANFSLKTALNNAGVQNIKEISDFNTNLEDFMQNPNIKPITTAIIIDNKSRTLLKNYDPNTNKAIFSQNRAEEAFKNLEKLENDKTNNKFFSPSWNETPPVGKFYANLANDIKEGFISVKDGIGAVKEGARDYTKFAAMDMNEYVSNKLASKKLVNALNISKLEPHFKQPTISSLMHQGFEDKALDRALGMKSQKCFVEQMTEKLSQEKSQDGISKSKY